MRTSRRGWLEESTYGHSGGELSSSAYIYHCIGDNYLEQSVSHMFGASGCCLVPVVYYMVFCIGTRGHMRASFLYIHACIYIYTYSNTYIHAKLYENEGRCARHDRLSRP